MMLNFKLALRLHDQGFERMVAQSDRTRKSRGSVRIADQPGPRKRRLLLGTATTFWAAFGGWSSGTR